MKNFAKIWGIIILPMIIAFSITACSGGSDNSLMPVAGDFTFGKMNQTVGSVEAVTITAKAGKSSGAISIKYNGNTALPDSAGTYPVTFDVAAVAGWKAATGLSAGNLIITPENIDEIENIENLLSMKLSWIKVNAQEGETYEITLTGDESLNGTNNEAASSLNSLSYEGKTVTIKLDGADSMRTISLNGIGNLFYVGDKVTLILENNIKLQGVNNNDRALVIVEKGSLDIKGNCEITGNTISSPADGYANGGGVWANDYAKITMSGGKIHGNTARSGGGMFIRVGSTFNMTGGSIENNTGNNGTGGFHMSATVAEMTTFTMSGGTIKNNISITDPNDGTIGGGGVRSGGNFTMSGGSIEDNTTTQNGGGVNIIGPGSFTMTGGTIKDNSAKYGGGVHVAVSAFTMSGGTIENNEATGEGGGVNIYNSAFTMTGGTIEENEADTNGGGVLIYYDSNNDSYENNQSTFEISGNSKINNNTAADAGGGICVYNSTLTINSGEINLNTAKSGGGIRISDNSTLNITGGNVDNNTGEGVGGIHASSITFTMSGGSISKNESTDENNSNNEGGGIRLGNSTFTMSGGTIENNMSARSGGGVLLQGGSTFTMTGGTIKDNEAKTVSGGVNVWKSTFTMSGGSITGNTAGGDGGGVWVSGDSTVKGIFEMSGGTIENNTTSANGGGVNVNNGSSFTMTNGSISGNSSVNGGGGVHVVMGSGSPSDPSTFNLSDPASITENTTQHPNSGNQLHIGRDCIFKKNGTQENNSNNIHTVN